MPIHICIGQRNSLSLNLLLLVYYSRCKSCTMVQISLKMSPQPKVGLYLQKKSLSLDPNRLKTGPLSCQKVTLPSLNFHHICNLGFIFLVHSVFQDTFLAPPSPSHPSPLSQREQSQQVKMCQTWEDIHKATTKKKTERETLKLTKPRSKSFSNSGPSSQQHHHQDPRSVLEACKNCKRLKLFLRYLGVYGKVSLLTQYALCTVHVKYESCFLDGDLSQGYCAYLFYLVLVLGTWYCT